MTRAFVHIGALPSLYNLHITLSRYQVNMFPHKSLQGLYDKLCATNSVLYLMISLFSLWFHTNTHLYPTSFKPLGVWTTCPKTSRSLTSFAHNSLRSHNFQILVPFQGAISLFRTSSWVSYSLYASTGASCSSYAYVGAFCSLYAFVRAFCLLYAFVGVFCFIFASLEAPIFLCVLLFQGVKSFESIGLPHFKRI